MIKLVQEFFTKNLAWKLFSIIVAIVLWCMVINITNPSETRPFSIPIKFTGEESLTKQNLVIANKSDLQNPTVIIKIRGSKLALDKLKNYEKILSATVDLQSTYYGTTVNEPNKVPIKIAGVEDFQILETNPQYVEIILEEIQTVQKEVKLSPTGEPKSNFVTLQPEINPSKVEVKGAASAITKLESVKVFVDITDISEQLSLKVEPKPCDSEGNPISGLEVIPKEIQVTIPINEYKKVPISALAQGLPEDGYTFTGIELNPQNVEIVGDSANLSKFTKLILPPIDISGLNTTTQITRNLRELIPENISIRNGTPQEVKITVKIAKEDVKEFQIPVENLTVSGFDSATHQYTLKQEPIKLNLKGLSDTINKMNVNSIKGNINIGDYAEGNYNVPVKFTLPSGIILVGNEPTVNITITNITQPQSTEEETTQSTTVQETTQPATEVFVPVNESTETTQASTDTETQASINTETTEMPIQTDESTDSSDTYE